MSSLRLQWLHRHWEASVLPTLAEYTRIPCLSPDFDPDWESNGALAEAAELLAGWAARRAIPGISVEVLQPAGRTPLLIVEVPGSAPQTDHGPPRCVLLYGHLDKQPAQGTWNDGLGPFEPVRQGDLLYGRGTADDGYALFASLSALEALVREGAERPPVVVLIEGSEESGSPDLPDHLGALAARIGRPELVVCLDSGCLTYDRLWTTASLRGNLVAEVRVDVLDEGVHSGMAGGVVPSSFRVLRQLLSRVEDEGTGEVILPALRAEVPATHRAMLAAAAEVLPDGMAATLPIVPGLRLHGGSDAERLVARAWAPALAVTGAEGLPPAVEAGNVLRPFTSLKLSLRLPPSVDAAAAGGALAEALERDPPEGARVRVTVDGAAPGWVAPEHPLWVTEALEGASRAAFGRGPGSYGEGGTIPFLAMLGDRFPGVPLVATGVLGPHSNAHGPNEFLHLPMAEAVSLAAAELTTAAARHQRARRPDGPGAGERHGPD